MDTRKTKLRPTPLGYFTLGTILGSVTGSIITRLLILWSES